MRSNCRFANTHGSFGPARSGSFGQRLRSQGGYVTDIRDRQSIAENLSTFSSHLVNIREILSNVCAPALVLMDELGTGTDPEEGSCARSCDCQERLRSKRLSAVVTTHHNGLKMYATTTLGVANASVEFDSATSAA